MKIKYTKSIVAFIDVLGFTNLIYSQRNESIENYYNYIITDFQANLKSNFKYTLISDSIVIYSNYSEENFFNLCKALSSIQAKLLFLRVIVRGGISFGNLYTNKKNNIIVGEGLVKAYKLESLAFYPRIIIDREFIRDFSAGTSDFLKKSNVSLSYEQSEINEGYIWIDYIKFLVSSSTILYKGERYLFLYDFLKENYYSNLYFQKYKWIISNLIYSLQYEVKYHKSYSGFSKSSRVKSKRAHELLFKFQQL